MSEAITVNKRPQKKDRGSVNHRFQRDKDRELVKGIFKFYEVPGGMMSFVYKAYKEDDVERYDLYDNQVYELPLGVAKHLNKNGWYPEYAYVPGEAGTKTACGMGTSANGFAPNIMRVGKKVRRFGFQSLEFVDIEDLGQVGKPVELVTIEKVA